MLALSTKSTSVTIDSVQQKILIAPNRLSFRPGAPKIIPFEEVEQVYLDFRDERYMVGDEYTSEEWTRRRWAILLTLKNRQTVTVGEETTEHRADETTMLAQQHARWEALAISVSELVGRPLTRMPEVPGGVHTFVEAIDDMLQRRLQQSGMNQLSVHVRSGKDLGVEIVVDGKSFAAVDEVEDEAIRRMIQASIDDWQGSGRG